MPHARSLSCRAARKRSTRERQPVELSAHCAGKTHRKLRGILMATLEASFLQGQLEERKRRLEVAVASAPRNSGLAGLLREVDAALDRMAEGTYGICLECHDSVERDRLLADPLVRYCLDHLTQLQRAALQRDLDLASQVQRNLLPQVNLQAG